MNNLSLDSLDTLVQLDETALMAVVGGVDFPPVYYDEDGCPTDDDVAGSGFPEWHW